MEDKKQTAVEWLEQEIKKLNISIDGATQMSAIRIIDQAKAMEREEILQFAIKAVSSAVNEDINAPYNLEQLYNETYGE